MTEFQSGNTTREIPNASVLAQERVALLGLLLAQLEWVSFKDTAKLLSVKPAQLRRYMRGEVSIPEGKEENWLTLSESLRCLHSVLKPTATQRWIRTPIKDLYGCTPINAIREGRYAQLLAVTQSYLVTEPV